MNNNLIIIPFGLDWHWLCDYEIQTAKELAKNNLVITFTPGSDNNIMCWAHNPRPLLKQIEPNLLQFQSINIFPFQRFHIVKCINTFINICILQTYIYYTYTLRSAHKILWIFPTKNGTYPAIFFRNYYQIYDCVDFEDMSSPNKIKQLLKADLVVTPSQSLRTLYMRYGVKAKIVPLGFALDDFTQKQQRRYKLQIPSTKPYIVYIGNINMRFNFSYLFSLITSLPSMSFVFVGNIDYGYQPHNHKLLKEYVNKLKKISNVYMINALPRPEIAPILQNASAALIPFDQNQNRVKYSYPMKTMEYFYFGLPILSTSIHELTRYKKYIVIENNGNVASHKLKKYLQKSEDTSQKEILKKIALANTWEIKINKIRSILLQRSTIKV